MYKFGLSNLLINIKLNYLINLLKLIFYFLKNQNAKYPQYLIKFEKKISSKFKFKFCLTFSNGTSAAESIFKSLNVFNKNVVVSKLTFPSIICALLRNGAKLYYLDIDRNLQLIINKKEEILKSSEILILTNTFGFMHNKTNIEKIKNINKDIQIIEDMSHSQGASTENTFSGKHGVASFMSMQGNKAISAGEGGIAFTDSLDLYKKMIIYSHINRTDKSFDEATNNLIKIGLGSKARMNPLGVFRADFDLDNLNNRNNKIRIIAKLIYEKLNKNKKITSPLVTSYDELGGFHYGIPFFISKNIISEEIIKEYKIQRYNWPALDKSNYFQSYDNFKKIKLKDANINNLFNNYEDLRDDLFFFDLKFIIKLKKNKLKTLIDNFLNAI